MGQHGDLLSSCSGSCPPCEQCCLPGRGIVFFGSSLLSAACSGCTSQRIPGSPRQPQFQRPDRVTAAWGYAPISSCHGRESSEQCPWPIPQATRQPFLLCQYTKLARQHMGSSFRQCTITKCSFTASWLSFEVSTVGILMTRPRRPNQQASGKGVDQWLSIYRGTEVGETWNHQEGCFPRHLLPAVKAAELE
jgi:hypothetical protein